MKKSTFFIIGKHAVIEALKNPKRKVLRIFLTEQSKKNINRENQNHSLLKDIKIYYKSKKELDNYTNKEGILHQGYVAEVEELEKLSLKEFLKNNEKKLNFICLDDLTDPRNIGSIIRSAVSFGLDGLIVKERSFPSESKLLYKSASGAMEYINIFKVSNIKTAIKFLKDNNFWVYAFENSAKKNFTEIDWKGNNVLLFGSEGYGLRKHTNNYADFLVKINISNKIESLNVSNTASIVFHHINFLKKTID